MVGEFVACPHRFVVTPPHCEALRLLEELEAAYADAAADVDGADDDMDHDDDERWDAFQSALDAVGPDLTLYDGLGISSALGPLAGVDDGELLWSTGARGFACTDGMTSYLTPEQVAALAARLSKLSAGDVEQALKGVRWRRAPLRDFIAEAEALLAVIATAATNQHGLLVEFDG